MSETYNRLMENADNNVGYALLDAVNEIDALKARIAELEMLSNSCLAENDILVHENLEQEERIAELEEVLRKISSHEVGRIEHDFGDWWDDCPDCAHMVTIAQDALSKPFGKLEGNAHESEE